MGSSKIKILNLLAELILLADEVRILIFDDPAEQEDWQRPQSGSREGKLSNHGGRALRARCNNCVSFLVNYTVLNLARVSAVHAAAVVSAAKRPRALHTVAL